MKKRYNFQIHIYKISPLYHPLPPRQHNLTSLIHTHLSMKRLPRDWRSETDRIRANNSILLLNFSIKEPVKQLLFPSFFDPLYRIPFIAYGTKFTKNNCLPAHRFHIIATDLTRLTTKRGKHLVRFDDEQREDQKRMDTDFRGTFKSLYENIPSFLFHTKFASKLKKMCTNFLQRWHRDTVNFSVSISFSSKSILPPIFLQKRRREAGRTGSLKGKRKLGNKGQNYFLSFFLQSRVKGTKGGFEACVRTRIHADKWSGGSLEKKKKEKEAKTKRGKKVEHNGRRKEWTSLKKPGAEGGGGRVGEETEKNQATKKRRQR